jgi:hypothetical protein
MTAGLSRVLTLVGETGLVLWKWRWIVLATAVVGLLLVAACGPFLDVRFSDERDYMNLAERLVWRGVYGHETGEPSAFRPPGYVFFITPMIAVGGGKPLIVIVQIFLWAATAFLCGRLAFQLSGGKAGGWAMALSVIYPLSAFAALTVYPQTLSATLLILWLWLLAGNGPDRFTRNLGAGLIGGLLVLVVPIFVPILGAMLGLLWLLRRISFRTAVSTTLIAAMLVAPWVARNSAVLGAPVMATNGGLNLLLGNSENAQAGLGVGVDISRYEDQSPHLGEIERDRFFRDAAISWALQHPSRAASLYAEKFAQFFGYREKLATPGEGGRITELILALTYYPLLALAVAALFMNGPNKAGRIDVLLFVVYVLGAAVYAVYFTRMRFRIPFDHVLVVLAGAFLARISGAGSQRAISVLPDPARKPDRSGRLSGDRNSGSWPI